MEIQYQIAQENDLDMLIKFYMDYYNAQGGTWTYEIAYKRIHQIAAMEDSLIILQIDKREIVGFLMGYFKWFDDSCGFFLEEILVSSVHQRKGYGTALLSYLKKELTDRKCNWIELLTTMSEQHQQFYKKNGYCLSDHLVLEYMDL